MGPYSEPDESSQHLFKICLNIIPQSTSTFSTLSLSFRFSYRNFVCVSSLSCMLHAPTYLKFCLKNTFREELMTPTFLQVRQSTKNDKQIIMQFSDPCLCKISLERQRRICQSNFLTVAWFVVANKVLFTTYLSIRFQWFVS
jgi:hypothetical protein